MSQPKISASDALQKLKKIGGKSGPTRGAAILQTAATTRKQRVFDSDNSLKSLGSGELVTPQGIEETKYENIQLKVEKTLTGHFDSKIDNIRSRQDNWHALIVTLIIGITIAAWLYLQGRFDSFTDRLAKVESLTTLMQEKAPVLTDLKSSEHEVAPAKPKERKHDKN